MMFTRRSLLLNKAFNFTKQLIRNEWKLRRVNPPLLGQNEESPYIVGPYILDRRPKEFHLEPRETVDDLYKDDEQLSYTLHKIKPINVILLTNIPGIGFKGEIVSVDTSLGRYQLIASKRAVYASEENLILYKELIEKCLNDPERPSSKIVHLTIDRLKKTFVSVIMSHTEPWIIEPWHIRVAMRLMKIEVPESAIKLPDTPITGPDLTKQNHDFAVEITLNNNPREKVFVRCTLHHSEIEIPFNWHRLRPRPAILPEQQELLDSMFFHEIYIPPKKYEIFGLSGDDKR